MFSFVTKAVDERARESNQIHIVLYTQHLNISKRVKMFLFFFYFMYTSAFALFYFSFENYRFRMRHGRGPLCARNAIWRFLGRSFLPSFLDELEGLWVLYCFGAPNRNLLHQLRSSLNRHMPHILKLRRRFHTNYPLRIFRKSLLVRSKKA